MSLLRVVQENFLSGKQRMQRQMSEKQVPSILAIAPAELEFPSCNTSDLGKKISRSMDLTNKTDNLVVFRIKRMRTNSGKYSIHPIAGYILPKVTCDITVSMRTPKEAPLNVQRRDKIIVQSARLPKSITASALTTDLINFLFKLLEEKSCSNFERKVMSIIVSPPLADEQPPMRSVFCLKNKKRIKDIEKVEDCFILEFDPYESFDLSSLSKCLEEVQDAPNIAVVAEKGQVACRDYPHPRHLCVVHPFNKTRHETHCKMCYCCVCDSPAPCKKWAKKSSNIAAKHCDATGNKVYEGSVNRIWHYGVQ